MNRRVFVTILGIAFCVTYLAGTIAMVGGLHATTQSLASSFDQGPVLVFSDEDFAISRIDGDTLPGNETTFVAFCFSNVTLRDRHGGIAENIYVVTIFDPEDTLGLGMTNETTNNKVWMGTQLKDILALDSIVAAQDETYTLEKGNNSVQITINNLYSAGSIFPDDWLLVPRTKTDNLRPELRGDYSFLMIIDSELPPDEQPWMTNDISTRPTSGVVGFFERGIYQVEQSLWGIIIMSGLMTSLLVYCIISIETEYNAPTIRILRGIGASREFVIRIFLMKALFITFVGGILGTALGFCAANAIASISSLLGVMTFITPVANINSVILPVIISIISGLIGGFWPAIRASKMFTVRRDAR